MNKIFLPDVTLLCVDCIDVDTVVAISEVSQRYIEFGSVKILSHLPSTSDHVIKIDPITSWQGYNFFIMKKVYKYIDTKYVLVFQADGFILNPFQWLDEFLEYDYIGAPWWYNDEHNVGNGGFSLRTRKLMEAAALDDHIAEVSPEDHCICRVYGNYLKEKGFVFAPDPIAAKFSIEGGKWNGQFGFHQADLSNWEIEKFADPERHAKYIDLFNKKFRPVAG